MLGKPQVVKDLSRITDSFIYTCTSHIAHIYLFKREANENEKALLVQYLTIPLDC